MLVCWLPTGNPTLLNPKTGLGDGQKFVRFCVRPSDTGAVCQESDPQAFPVRGIAPLSLRCCLAVPIVEVDQADLGCDLLCPAQLHLPGCPAATPHFSCFPLKVPRLVHHTHGWKCVPSCSQGGAQALERPRVDLRFPFLLLF